jgi:hypothetical protein
MANITVDPDSNNGLSTFSESTARDVLRALASPRNSHIELFQRPIQVSMRDLDDLGRRVADKLTQLRVDKNSAVVKTLLSLDKDRNFELIGWRQLAEFNWKIPEKTKALVITWEFMYQRDNNSPSNLHALSVRITEEPHPMHMLRAALSQDREEAERMEIRMSPVVCEVDYVDGLLSRELVQLVSGWHKSLRRLAPLTGIGEKVQSHQERIIKSADVSLELLIPIAYVAAVYAWMHGRIQTPVTTEYVSVNFILLMIFILVIKIANRFSSWVAETLNGYIIKMGRFPIFELTNGDQNNLTAALSRITRSTYKFWGGIALSFLINVASAVFTFYVLGLK